VAKYEKAIVVGGSTGIGRAMALQLAGAGAQVVVLGRREKELKELEKDPLAFGRITTQVHDVQDFDSIRGTFDAVVAKLGGLDVLIYAAGVMPKIEEGEYDFAKDKQMIDVNLVGAMGWMNPAAARFEAAKSGTIVGISSIAGERGRRGNPAYCTSKGALSIYLESLRNRCSRYGVNVVTIKPGFVDTAMTKGMKGLFWLVSADEAASQSLALARSEVSASAFVPSRWALVAFIVRNIPSFIFRKMNF
jgi:NAD(P)-dependent dehydrogenase (short-subunit alcohol dehydrogenase family)